MVGDKRCMTNYVRGRQKVMNPQRFPREAQVAQHKKQTTETLHSRNIRAPALGHLLRTTCIDQRGQLSARQLFHYPITTKEGSSFILVNTVPLSILG